VIGKETHLALTAGAEVRWDRVSVYWRERPVEKVLVELAELLNYAWIDNGAKRTLRADARARASGQNERRRWFGFAAERLLRYAGLAQRPPTYYRRMKENLKGEELALQQPLLDRLANPSLHSTLRLLLTLSEEQLLDLVSAGEQEYYLPWRQMTPLQQDLAFRIAQELESPAPSPKYLQVTSVPEARRWVQEMGLVLKVWLWPGTNYVKFCSVRLGDGNILCGYNIDGKPFSPQRFETRGNPYHSLGSRRRSTEDNSNGYDDLDAIPFPFRNFRQAYPSTWPVIFRQLAERLPFALYSDYFPAAPTGVDASYVMGPNEVQSTPAVLPLERMSVAEALDGLCACYGRVWWRRGDALFFRKRTWFLDRLFQTPPPVLTSLQEQLMSQGRLDRNGLDLLAGLTWRQIAGLYLLAQEQFQTATVMPWAERLHRAVWLLQFYGILAPPQKERSLESTGLPVAQMTTGQRYAYQEALYLCHATMAWIHDPPTFRFAQSVIPGVPERRPSLGELSFLKRAGGSGTDPRSEGPALAVLYIPYPAKRPEEENAERRH
jgi:hypothetical protein